MHVALPLFSFIGSVSPSRLLVSRADRIDRAGYIGARCSSKTAERQQSWRSGRIKDCSRGQQDGITETRAWLDRSKVSLPRPRVMRKQVLTLDNPCARCPCSSRPQSRPQSWAIGAL